MCQREHIVFGNKDVRSTSDELRAYIPVLPSGQVARRDPES